MISSVVSAHGRWPAEVEVITAMPRVAVIIRDLTPTMPRTGTS